MAQANVATASSDDLVVMLPRVFLATLVANLPMQSRWIVHYRNYVVHAVAIYLFSCFSFAWLGVRLRAAGPRLALGARFLS